MKTKAIAAIMLTVLLVGLAFNVVPVLAVEPIKIGVLGPMYWMQGQGIQEGATLAAEEINVAGGILGHSVELYFANTHPDAATDPTNETGAAAMEELMSYDVDFAVGSFVSEATFGGREVAVDNKKIFIIAGAAAKKLVDCADNYDPDGPFGPTPPGPCGACARCDYERYKYVFRVNPANESMLFSSVVEFSKYTMVEKLMPIYTEYAVPLPIAVVTEDAVWADIIHDYFAWELFWNTYMGLETFGGVDVVYETRVDPVDPGWVSGVVAAIEASGAKLILETFTWQVGRDFAIEWGTVQVDAALVGFDAFGVQIPLHWDATGGKCEYETIFAWTSTGTRIPITDLSIPFWDAYVARWGHNPLYIAFATYDAIHTLKEAIEAFGYWPPTDQADYDNLIPILEQTDRIGTIGKFKFTQYHDVFCASIGSTWPDGYTRPFIGQWQAGRLEVIWPADQPYSEDLGLPPWMLNTPVGSDVTVTDPIADVTTTFSETTSVGTTTVIVSDTGPSPPTGFSLAGSYYDITTTSSYTGPIEIAIEYDETLVENETDLKLLHWDPVNETWEDATTWVDTTNNIIYGEVAILSLFAVMEQLRIPATVDIDPDTLNLKTNGEWITAYIELPEGYDVADIDLSTVFVDGIPAVTDPQYGFVTDPNSYLTDHDGDGILERMVKFDRASVRETFTDVTDYEEGTKFYDLLLTVTGEVAGTPFEGSDTITVIYKGS